jgi:hypothetical protein
MNSPQPSSTCAPIRAAWFRRHSLYLHGSASAGGLPPCSPGAALAAPPVTTASVDAWGGTPPAGTPFLAGS